MITANKIKIEPTIFSDGTSQVWKLPEELVDAWEVNIVWHFESEAEIMHLLSLRRLLYTNPMTLHMPFLPYARQDKKVSNTSTFNLEIFADLLNGMRFSEVTAVDTHNYIAAGQLIKNFRDIEPDDFHKRVISEVKPKCIVFPDHGASERYGFPEFPVVVMDKHRDGKTGNILRLKLERGTSLVKGKVLIVDDICDGGLTFIMAARALKEINPNIEIHLAVTHGIFSKGLKPLIDEEIIVHCYNSLNKSFTGAYNVH